LLQNIYLDKQLLCFKRGHSPYIEYSGSITNINDQNTLLDYSQRTG
jgi:hypothetical protein